jgi:predicted HicB family RNase H-like nuclease
MIFHGRLVGIGDIVSFEADTATGLIKAFRDSVNDYLDYCDKSAMQPEKPYSGNISLRMGADLHKSVSDAAGARAVSVNQWIIDTLKRAAKRDIESGETVVKA